MQIRLKPCVSNISENIGLKLRKEQPRHREHGKAFAEANGALQASSHTTASHLIIPSRVRSSNLSEVSCWSNRKHWAMYTYPAYLGSGRPALMQSSPSAGCIVQSWLTIHDRTGRSRTHCSSPNNDITLLRLTIAAACVSCFVFSSGLTCQ